MTARRVSLQLPALSALIAADVCLRTAAQEPSAHSVSMHRFPVGIPYAQRPVEAGARNANICTALERTSQPIGDMHRPIAVHALAENATQLTNNACKFTRVPGPQVEAWE